MKTKVSKQDSQSLGARKPKDLNRIDKIWEQENQRVFRPYGFLAPIFCISCLALWLYCSQILYILFRPFGLPAPRFCLSRFVPLVFLLPDFGE
jgi:hypothetical protein